MTLTERHVQAVWYDSALRPKRLFTRRGTSVAVVSPGEWNLGRGRAAALVANVVLPFAMAEGRVVSAPDWLPPEDISEPVRIAAFQMFGRDHNPRAVYARNGVMIQGLIEVYNRCCRKLACEHETNS